MSDSISTIYDEVMHDDAVPREHRVCAELSKLADARIVDSRDMR
jgi:uncharacterized protein (UPF0147 family)